MKFKRLLAFTLAICMLVPMGAFAAGEATEAVDDSIQNLDRITNGSAEKIGGDGFASSWWHTGENITITDEDAHTGDHSMKIIANDTKLTESVCQKINGLVGGGECTLTFWVKVLEGPTSVMTKFEIRDEGNTYHNDSIITNILTHQIPARRRWQKVSIDFTLPQKANNGYFYIRFLDGSNLLLDDISIVGPVSLKQDLQLWDIPEGAENMILNGDFEIPNDAGNGAKDWVAVGEWGGEWASYVDDPERGKVAQVVSDGSANPWVRQIVEVTPKARYQIMNYVKTEDMTGTLKYKIEYYNAPKISSETSKGEAQSPYFNATYGTWQLVGSTVEPPVGATHMAVYMRLYGAGKVSFDDVQVYKVADPVHMYTSVSAFNYDDCEYGIAAARPNTITYDIPIGSTMQFEILDGETVIDTYTTKAVADTRYNFEVKKLTEYDKEYTMRITYRDGDGNVLQATDLKVNKVKRPKDLLPDGTFINNDGEKVTPVVGYHIGKMDDFDKAPALGINVLQWNPSGSASALKNALDKAQELGIYLAVLLYDNGRPAGHPSNVQKTTNIINACKDHPAVFAWMVQDEAYWADPNCYPFLYDSYKLIHSLDDRHPVYLLESSEFFGYEVAGVSDYYVIDRYIGRGQIKDVGDRTKSNADISKELGRPLLSILQAFDYIGSNPNSNDMRNQIYQSFMVGGNAVGYYPLMAEMGNVALWERENQEGIKAFHNDELEDAVNVFVTDKYKTFAEAVSPNLNVWYNIYVKNNTFYMIVVNRANEEMAVDIPLTSGGARIGEFTAIPVDISGAPQITGNGRYQNTLAPQQVIKYKLVTDGVNLNDMKKPRFTDLEGVEWAEEQINFLGNIDVVTGVTDTEFAPNTAITRGDFAKYLVRTLGLLGDPIANFDDVDPNASYAKEVMIGKSLGILTGVGDNKYEPEAQISRQDLMTICARALKYTGNIARVDTTFDKAFTDSSMISDYAVEHVNSMVFNGIVQGNADGTVNPLGNTTRAEAAVIMYRMFNYKAFDMNPEGVRA